MADEPENADVLSQSEVEAILSSVHEEEKHTPVIRSGARHAATDVGPIQTYDFRAPSFLTATELRRLRIRHEEFLRSLSSTLSLFLRMEFNVQMSHLEALSYEKMLDNLPAPSHLTLFKMNPLDGVALFDISPRLGLTVIDRMLGGPGHSIKDEREFTDIERVVLQNFITVVLQEYANSWRKYQKLEAEAVETENSARFLNIVDPLDIMIFLGMEVKFGDCVAAMRLALPYNTMEVIIHQLLAEVSGPKDERPRNDSQPLDLSGSGYSVPVPLSAYWRGFTLSLNDVQALEEGDLLWLDPSVCKQVYVDLGKHSKFWGTLDRGAGASHLNIGGKLEGPKS